MTILISSQLADQSIQQAMSQTPGTDYAAAAYLLLVGQRQANAVEEATLVNLRDHVESLRKSQAKVDKAMSLVNDSGTGDVVGVSK